MPELLANITPTQWLIGGLTLLLVILAIWLARLETRLKRLSRGKHGVNLEDVINEIVKELRLAGDYRAKLDQYLTGVEARLKRSVQGVGTVRFNPFPDQGSNQSFSAAFLDEEGNGVVISTLYSREKVGVYAKPIRKFVSEFQLTDEEKQSLEKARPK